MTKPPQLMRHAIMSTKETKMAGHTLQKPESAIQTAHFALQTKTSVKIWVQYVMQCGLFLSFETGKIKWIKFGILSHPDVFSECWWTSVSFRISFLYPILPPLDAYCLNRWWKQLAKLKSITNCIITSSVSQQLPIFKPNSNLHAN